MGLPFDALLLLLLLLLPLPLLLPTTYYLLFKFLSQTLPYATLLEDRVGFCQSVTSEDRLFR